MEMLRCVDDQVGHCGITFGGDRIRREACNEKKNGNDGVMTLVHRKYVSLRSLFGRFLNSSCYQSTASIALVIAAFRPQRLRKSKLPQDPRSFSVCGKRLRLSLSIGLPVRMLHHSCARFGSKPGLGIGIRAMTSARHERSLFFRSAAFPFRSAARFFCSPRSLAR